MFMPITGRFLRRLTRATRAATVAAPWLLNPIRLITARSGMRRNSLGLSFPGWAIAVTVPISTCEKPKAPRPRMPRPSLSNPAATPNGPVNSNPSALVRNRPAGRANAVAACRNSGSPSILMTTKARPCARSGSRCLRTRRKSARYIPGSGYRLASLVNPRKRCRARRAGA